MYNLGSTNQFRSPQKGAYQKSVDYSVSFVSFFFSTFIPIIYYFGIDSNSPLKETDKFTLEKLDYALSKVASSLRFGESIPAIEIEILL